MGEGLAIAAGRRAGVKPPRQDASVWPHSRRHLDWDGCFDVRDLGELRADEGRETRWGALVRADALDGLTAAGWARCGHGVRTVIELREPGERGEDAAPPPRWM